MVSPLLANVYLHYVFDLWVEALAQESGRRAMSLSSATLTILWWASKTGRKPSGFLREFRERLAKFGLELHADKTRLIEFGRFAAREPEDTWRGKT